MSLHGSNGLGSVVATIGLFIVVSIGAAVDRSSTVVATVGAGARCQPTMPPTTAVISAAIAPIKRILVNTTPPDVVGGPLPGVYKSRQHASQ